MAEKAKTTWVGLFKLDVGGALKLDDLHMSDSVAHEKANEEGIDRYILLPVYGWEEHEVKVTRRVASPTSSTTTKTKKENES